MTTSVPVCDIHVLAVVGLGVQTNVVLGIKLGDWGTWPSFQAFFTIGVVYGDMVRPSSCPRRFGIHAYVTGPRSGAW